MALCEVADLAARTQCGLTAIFVLFRLRWQPLVPTTWPSAIGPFLGEPLVGIGGHIDIAFCAFCTGAPKFRYVHVPPHVPPHVPSSRNVLLTLPLHPYTHFSFKLCIELVEFLYAKLISLVRPGLRPPTTTPTTHTCGLWSPSEQQGARVGRWVGTFSA